jgi:hypothetical protein
MIDAYTSDLLLRKIIHEVHTSGRHSFRGCRRRWNWVFNDNIYPVTTAKPLEFGVAFHIGMEAMFNPQTWKFSHLVLGALAEKAFVDKCEQQRKAYLHAKQQYVLEDDEQHDYDERIALGRGMIRYFVEKQLPAIQEKYVPVYVEASFDVLLVDNDGSPVLCKCKQCKMAFARAGGGRWKGNPVCFSGRVDLIVHDMEGGYWVWDWKSAASLTSDIEIYLELDDQVAGYVYALRKGLGLNIRGFMYHEQRKAFPEPPKENKTIRLGRKFSVNVQQATDYETYRAHVEEFDKEAYEAGLYDDFLNFLQAEGIIFYRRFKIYKSDYELEEFERNLIAETREMIRPDIAIYPEPSRFGCGGCAYKEPCLSKNAGQDYEYTLQTMFEVKEPYYRRNLPLSTERGALSAD